MICLENCLIYNQEIIFNSDCFYFFCRIEECNTLNHWDVNLVDCLICCLPYRIDFFDVFHNVYIVFCCSVKYVYEPCKIYYFYHFRVLNYDCLTVDVFDLNVDYVLRNIDYFCCRPIVFNCFVFEHWNIFNFCLLNKVFIYNLYYINHFVLLLCCFVCSNINCNIDYWLIYFFESLNNRVVCLLNLNDNFCDSLLFDENYTLVNCLPRVLNCLVFCDDLYYCLNFLNCNIEVLICDCCFNLLSLFILN